MYATLAVVGFAALAQAIPAGVTSAIAPKASSPPGCRDTVQGTFQITTYNASQGGVMKRQANGQTTLHLTGGRLYDQDNDVGYIAQNRQFQFDPNVPQAGAIYTAGWSLCPNNSLALGGSTIFYSCNSGNFNNLYDQKIAPYCSPVYINAIDQMGAGAQSGPSVMPAASQAPDAQPQAKTSAAAAPATQITDKQPQAMTAAPKAVTQITDKQPQAGTVAPKAITMISDKQPQALTYAPMPAAVTQIGDKQPQAATSAAAVTQISDKQPQAATSAAAITQISDKQPQAATSAAAISQIGDKQPQAATSAVAAVTPVTPAATPRYTGAAAAPTGFANFALAGAAVVGAALL